MTSKSRTIRGAAVCWAIALVLSTGVALAGTLPEPTEPANDCVNSDPQVVRGGGTNGVNSVFAIDVDDDGDIDILSASANDDKIIWYENDGTGDSFTEHVVSSIANGATSVYAKDLDGDDDTDIVSASAEDNKIAWYENIGSGGFGLPIRFVTRVITTSASKASSVFIGDIDLDGDEDVLAASYGDDTVAVYASDLAPQLTGTPTFTEIIISDFADGAASVYAADIYPDPDPDDLFDNGLEVLVASSLDNRIAWYEKVQLADEVVIYVERVIDSGAAGAVSVFAIDIDDDDNIDVLSASGNDNKISWYRNDGDDPPSFTKHIISNQLLGAAAVFAADLDGDGDDDVLSASRFDNSIAWYENLGGGIFGDPTDNRKFVTTDAPGASAVFAIDMDLDGDFDVTAASSVPGVVAADDKIAWHESDLDPMDPPTDPPPSFTEHVVSGGSVAPQVLLTVDMDGVGGLDILTASAVDDTILWFANDGAEPPTFTENLLSDQAPGARDLFWADLDDDMEMDVVAALAGDDSIAWYRNLGNETFGPRTDIALLSAANASSVFVIDLDNDLLPDVLSASASRRRISASSRRRSTAHRPCSPSTWTTTATSTCSPRRKTTTRSAGSRATWPTLPARRCPDSPST